MGLLAVAGFFVYIAESDTEQPTIESVAFSTPTQPQEKLTPAEVAEKIKPSTVYISTTFTETDALLDDEFAASGTGVIVFTDDDGDYWILTNSHVMGYYEMVASDTDGEPEIDAYGVEVTFHNGNTEVTPIFWTGAK